MNVSFLHGVMLMSSVVCVAASIFYSYRVDLYTRECENVSNILKDLADYAARKVDSAEEENSSYCRKPRTRRPKYPMDPKQFLFSFINHYYMKHLKPMPYRKLQTSTLYARFRSWNEAVSTLYKLSSDGKIVLDISKNGTIISAMPKLPIKDIYEYN